MISLRTLGIFSLTLLLGFTACGPRRSALEKERVQHAVCDIHWLDAYPPDLSEPLSLNSIIEIALCKNLELFIQKQEFLLQEDQATKVRFALLPQLNFNFVDTRRSRNSASSSIFVDPANDNPTKPIFQLGSPKHIQNWDFGFVWNVLDFGVTYFRSRQQADRVASACYDYDRIRNSVILRATTSYWRGVAAKQALDRATILLPDMLAQTDKLLREIEDRVYLTKDQALEKVVFFYQREVQVRGFNDRNDSSDPTQGYGKEYEAALLDLSALMQLPPGACYDILIPDDDLPFEADLPCVDELFVAALANRPELYVKDLDYKIASDDVKIALIQTFPGLQLFNIQNWNSNPFLLHNRWYEAGLRIAWNLLEFPQHAMDNLIGQDLEERNLRQRMLISQGVLTQVSLAYMQYSQNVEQYVLARKIARANQAVADLNQLQSNVGKKSKLEALQSKINAALAYNNVGKIYAELQTNLEQLNNAIGLPRYYSTFKNDPCVLEYPSKTELGESQLGEIREHKEINRVTDE